MLFAHLLLTIAPLAPVQLGTPDRARLRAPLPAHGWSGTLKGDVVIDLDEDGDLDVLRLDQQLYLLENDGRGKFVRVELAAAAPFYASHVAVADFDGSPGLDIAYRGPSTFQLFVRQNDGSYLEHIGAFPTVPDFGPISAGDVDGDGDTDLAAAGYRAPDRILLNDGAGNFSDIAPTNFAAAQSVNVKLADFDGDGTLDLLSRELFLNDGAGVFTQKAGAGVPTTWHHVVDPDGDGDLDIVYEDFGPRYHPNDGTGSFGPGQFISGFGLNPRFFDWDADGDVDIITAGPYDQFFSTPSPGIFLWRNDGSFPFRFVPQPEANAIDAIVGELLPADFDRDGDPDIIALAAIGYAGLQDAVLWNEDRTLTSSLPNPESMDTALLDAQLADLDGDGDLDAITSALTVHENDGLGLFQLHPSISVGIPQTGLACPDLDGDGDLDLIATFDRSANLRMWRNTGALGFVEISAPSVGSIAIVDADIRIAELNGIAGDDVVMLIRRAPSSTREVRILLSDGAGGLLDATASSTLPPFPRAIALGDLDRDGDHDLLLAHGKPLPWSIEAFANSGNGSFQATGAALNDPTGHGLLRLVDMDGDNLVDLIAATLTSANLHRGLGTGSFEANAAATLPFGPPFVTPRGKWLGLPVSESSSLPDVFSSQGYLYRNLGGFSFADESGSLTPLLRPGAHVAFGDLDGDGDQDAWFDGPEVHWALDRQLATRWRPALARPLRLDVHGPANSLFVLAMSLGRNTQTTPWGLLHLDLNTLVMQGSGPLDAQGRGAALFEIPANTALVNLDVFWQAVVGNPPRLTNGELTRLSAE